MVEEKRAYTRYSFSEPVAYGLPDVTVNGSIARNISLGGISLKVHGFVPMGAILELELSLGDSSGVIWAKAEVVRIREVSSEDCYEVGLKFLHDGTSKKAINKYIEDCQSINR